MPRKTSSPPSPVAPPERPFPWRCRHCGQQQVQMATGSYRAEVRHDGRVHAFEIPHLTAPACGACGERIFTEAVDRQVSAALRAHLRLLTPDQIKAAIRRLGKSQKDAAGCLGIAEETLSRWLNDQQIQSRSMDNWLRAYFAFPPVRAAFRGAEPDPQLGLADVATPIQPTAG